MGETIQRLMVAIVAFVGFSATNFLQAQNSGGSLADAFAGAAGKFAGAVSDTAQNIADDARRTSTPNFTSGFDPQPVGRRAGGPSTDPAKRNNGTWLSPEAAARGSRPTTNPYARNVSTKTPASIDVENALRGSQIATVGATEDPNSAEAQLRARANRNMAVGSVGANNRNSNIGNPNSLTGNASAPNSMTPPSRTGATTGFAKPPGGISFPKSLASEMPATQADSGAAARFSAANFGGSNKTSETGIPASRPNAMAPNGQQTNASSAMGMPNNSAANSTNTTGFAFSALGSPNNASPTNAQPNAFSSAEQSSNSSLATNWTVEQVKELGSRFGILANDDRLANPAFVNRLHEQWLAHLAKQNAPATATGQLGSTNGPFGTNPTAGQTRGAGQHQGSGQLAGNPTTLWPNTTASAPASTSSGQLNLPGFTAPQSPSNPYASQNNPALIAANTPNQPAVSAPLSTKRFYDRYGNVTDIDGNVYENGQIVDEARKYELTVGKKIREDMEKILQEREKLDRERREQFAQNSPQGVQSPSDGRAVGGNPNLNTLAGQRSETGKRANTDLDKSADGKSIAIDQAGIGGSTKSIGSSNPYVNVFLLCSLVANIFLFVWLHKLWYHHRDLIASSRMASSGISTNE